MKGNQEHNQLVVPAEYCNQVTSSSDVRGHTIYFNGHMDTGATTQMIACHYYYPGMNGGITKYAKSCTNRQRATTKHSTDPFTLRESPYV